MDKQFIEDIVMEVKKDFEQRALERRSFEAQWQLNANFVMGNQYCRIGAKGEVEDVERDYYWQEREVYNHIATILETRLAKLSRVRPKMSVAPQTNDEDDIRSAKVASKILSASANKLHLSDLIAKATMWSELTGSVFYKVGWSQNGGKIVGENEQGEIVREGEVTVDICPPFEIFPDALSNTSLEECNSVMHAKSLHVDEILRIWGKKVKGEESEILTYGDTAMVGSFGITCQVPKVGREKKSERALVIERYTRPSKEKPNGELVIVAGDQLLYYGDLPYQNGEEGERIFPFVCQKSIERAGCFFGTSMVERAIPIQRAYNAVKNRKHEFLNRIAMGVLTVEDGSVDTENLEIEGLSPGKILVYRQGSTPPRLMNPGSVPSDFTIEEQRLLSEFVDVSGISEIMRSSSVPSTVTSGLAIQLLIEQDDTRISVTAESIRTAVRKIASMLLRLYRQFVCATRLIRYTGEDGQIELISWTKSDVASTDIRFETDNEINSTNATRQSLMFDLLKAGLLHDENGKLSDAMRYKILEAFGYGGLEQTQDIKSLHCSRAGKENAVLERESVEVSEVDDHALHISEHTKHYLSGEFAKKCKKNPELEKRFIEHIRAHKAIERAEKEVKGE